jgi:hypothetical protein
MEYVLVHFLMVVQQISVALCDMVATLLGDAVISRLVKRFHILVFVLTRKFPHLHGRPLSQHLPHLHVQPLCLQQLRAMEYVLVHFLMVVQQISVALCDMVATLLGDAVISRLVKCFHILVFVLTRKLLLLHL